MERLTTYKTECNREMICRYEECDICEEYCPISQEDNCSCLKEILEKLGQYEDLEKQGLLLMLPCKVGDTAYYLHRVWQAYAGEWIDVIDEVEVDSFVLNINLFVNVSYYIGSERYGKTLTPYKTLFFTREEAEAALKKMEEE